jgi:hypothetical protein
MKVYRSTVVDSPIDSVWGKVRDFGDWASWLSAITTSEIEDSKSGDSVGCVRSFSIEPGGPLFREQLVALSDRDHSLTYTALKVGVPVENFEATLSLLPVTDEERTFAQWAASFDADDDKQDEIADLLANEVFGKGFAGLGSLLASS